MARGLPVGAYNDEQFAAAAVGGQAAHPVNVADDAEDVLNEVLFTDSLVFNYTAFKRRQSMQ